MDIIPAIDKELQKKVYDDLFAQGCRHAGMAIWNIAGLLTVITLPIAYLNHYSNSIFRKNIEKLNKKIESHTLEENIIPVEPEIGVPILEKLTYTQNDSIANLFLELLKKASNREEVWLVHPKYIKIIEDLSPDEAIILSYLDKIEWWMLMTINIHFADSKTGNYIIKLKNFCTLFFEPQISFPDNIGTYLNNLSSLGIISIEYDKHNPNVWDSDPYDFLKNHPSIIEIKNKWSWDIECTEFRIQKGVLSLTDLGLSFLRSVRMNKT